MKLGMIVHHHDPECYAQMLGSYLQGQGHSIGANLQKITFFQFSRISKPFATRFGIVGHHHVSEYCVTSHPDMTFAVDWVLKINYLSILCDNFCIAFIKIKVTLRVHILFNMKYYHPLLAKILELHLELQNDDKEIVFIWVSGHVGIRGNYAADSAAKDALDSDISDELIPFSDLKPRLNKYLVDLWQMEWDNYPYNKLYKTFSKLKECVTPQRSNR